MTRILFVLLVTAAAMPWALATGATAADTFGFNAEHIAAGDADPPWHGKSKYVFMSEDRNPRTSITVDAFDLDGYTSCPPVLLKGETSNAVIGVGTDCDPFPRAWLNEGYRIFLGQPAVSVAITLEHVGADRDVLWEVFGVDAAGKQVFFQGTFRGRGVPGQSWTIDQATLASTPVRPLDGFARPVGINAVNIKSLAAGATLPAFGSARLDESIYLIAVKAAGF
jgi:hypothetical protein